MFTNLRGYNPHECPDDETVWSATYSKTAREDFVHDAGIIGLTVEEVEGESGKWLRVRGDTGICGEWTPREGGMIAWNV